ncbi:WD40-repeat-containing domain protein [Aspergillus venezuelensis]
MTRYHDLPEVPRSEPIFFSPSHEIPSSPPSIASDAGLRLKPKKPPPVTPRSFRRFFTPRSLQDPGSHGNGVRTSRQALMALSSPAVNRLGPAFTRTLKAVMSSKPEPTDLTRTPSKKRKMSFSSIGSPLQSSPIRKVRVRHLVEDDEEIEIPLKDVDIDIGKQVAESKPTPPTKAPLKVAPIRRSKALETSGAFFMRSVTGTRANRVTMRTNSGAGWQDLTSTFYSRPDDSHACTSSSGDRLALPFCTAACNTNTLVAVGDEEGGIRLLDSAKNDKVGFSKAFLSFRPHANAIMDMDFSSDDMLLATASGDQTAIVIDMATQKPVYCLSNHVSSLKQVRFQPAANNKVLVTCSRDGNVSIWDLRCKGFEKPSLQVQCSLESESELDPAMSKMTYPQVLNTVHGAHAWMPQIATTEKPETQVARSDITVTSLAFLPPGRENLFVTASEANACVRLWDLRTAHNNRRGRPALPLSTTREPDSHIKYRRFGVTSMALGGDGSRLYSLCRDGTVYAYSTSHLVLGHAPELSLNNDRPRRSGGTDKDGLGPLYGFRHPRLRVSSFYVKLGVRKAAGDKSEMLAVGSGEPCPLIFPTDEKFLDPTTQQQTSPLESPRTPSFSTRSGLRRTNSSIGLSGRLEDMIPIYQTGTPLIEGHKKEVSGVSWTSEGEFVTVSDDYSARCWREGLEARDLRVGGETEGRRWRCGWADTKDSFDDEDE